MEENSAASDERQIKRKSIFLIVLFGLISLLGDVIYEGARSVHGPYLKTLGANALIVGFVVGLGEVLGYAIRIISGYLSDKSKLPWLFIILGYGLLLSIPLLSLTGIWQMAAFFIVLERVGKGIRAPAKDTILSHATKQVGTGIGFGFAELLDQIGAILGPLIFTLYFFTRENEITVDDYHAGYQLYWIPYIIMMIIVLIAFTIVKNPESLEKTPEKLPSKKKAMELFWTYTIYMFITSVGFINFAIAGYHWKANNIFTDFQIPGLYAIAMFVDAIFGLVAGKLYDNFKVKKDNEYSGVLAVIFIPVFSILSVIIIFTTNLILIYVAVFFWGVVMGMHETIMKASLADIIPKKERGRAYGSFSVFYGVALFLGAALSGYLYEISIPLLIGINVVFQGVALLIFFVLRKKVDAMKTDSE